MKKRMVLLLISDNSNLTKLKAMLEPRYFTTDSTNIRQAEILINQNMDLIDSIIISEDIEYKTIVDKFKNAKQKPAIIVVGYTVDQSKINNICSDGVTGFVNYTIKREEMLSKIEKLFQENDSENSMRTQMLNQVKSNAISSVKEESSSFGSFRIDLTKHVLCNQTGFIADFMEKQKIKTLKELIAELSERLVYFSKTKFNDLFSFDSIADAISGAKQLQVRELFNFSGHIYCLEITASSFTDISVGSSYALILFKDMTPLYQEKKLETGIFEKEYDLIASINASTQKTNIQYNNGTYETISKKEIPYKDLHKMIVDHFSISEENSDLSHKIEIETVLSNLKEHSMYDIVTIINQKKMVFYRITFRYLDEFEESIILYIENITGLKEIDYITGSFNYQGFLNRCFDEMYQSQKSYSIINCSCSNYKDLFELISVDSINIFLKEFNQTLRRSSLKPICIGRSSTDNFWLLVESKNVSDENLENFDNIPIQGDDKVFHLNVKFGIFQVQDSVKINSTTDIDLFCERARTVQSYLQTNCDKNFAYFDQSMSEEYLKKAKILNDIPEALSSFEFEVYFQPIFDTRKKKIVAAEALLRWFHKDYGYISPAVLIPAIEANGLVSKVDNYVITRTDEFLNRLHKRGCHIPVSVNLSRLDFYDGELVNNILNIARSNAGHSHMNFEVTESYYIEISSSINQVLTDLRQTGAKILLDDFGDGFSSFRALITTDFDIIKIYKGMVDQIGTNKTSEQAIKAIIKMAHSVGLQVVAEGVEYDYQLKFLKKNKCDLIQGFIYSKPIPESEFVSKYLDSKKRFF